MRALELLQKVGRYLYIYDDPYSPNSKRRAEVIEQLSQRPSLSHEEWHARFAAPKGIPLKFVAWFRDTCSKYFEYDLSGALPDDRLIEDLGLFEATWGDTDWDILEEYEGEFSCKRPQSGDMKTFGALLEGLWTHAKQRGTV